MKLNLQASRRLHRLISWSLFLAALAGRSSAQTPDAFNPMADNDVYAMAVQPDGTILLGGYFTHLGGPPCNYLGRLSPDGALDTTFSPQPNSDVVCLAVQDDGKLLVGGEFSTMAGQNRLSLARFNTDGSLDPAVNPGVSGSVSCLAVQEDGRILVGGHFTALAGQPRNNLGRLYPDGTLDAAFNPGATKSSYTSVLCLALQPDGEILVGGSFTTLGGQARTNIGRLDASGTLDTTFDPGAGGYYSGVVSMLVQADGKILVGGSFPTLSGQPATNIARLNIDGSLDTNFNSGASGGVVSLALQADGRVVVAGSFTNLAGAVRTYIGRLNADGTVDPAFNPPPTGGSYPLPQMVPYVSSLALQADGNVLVGGHFTTFAGQTRTNVGRLVNTTPATQSMVFDGSSINWLRGGTGAEVWRARFDATTNGHDWLRLGPVTRVPGGWRVSGLALPTNATIRARGFLTGGYYNGSSWSEESVLGPPAIISEPFSRTNNAATVATFSVQAGGAGTLSYLWRKEGLDLLDGGNISGTRTPTLTLTNVLGGDAGGYSVVVAGAGESVTSLVAQLSVVDPLIVTPPANQSANQGQTATLTVTAAGTAPLHYQWRKNGVSLPGNSTSSLTLTNAQGTDAACYEVVVSNRFGLAVSPVGVLTVNLIAPDPWGAGADYVDSMAVLRDGRIVVSGGFTFVQGYPRDYIAQLNADGTVDTAFRSLGNNCMADSLVVQPDGMILMGGDITSLPGQRIRRLAADGTLDATFALDAGYEVICLALQPDGKILAGGSFTTLAGQGRGCIGRLNANGTLDTDFNPGADGAIVTLALQPDGKILAGGSFTSLGGAPCNLVGRLNPSGTPDTGFNPGATNGYVNCLAVQPDGKILVGGSFTALGGQPRNGIGRLNPDGSIDTGFNPGLGGSSAEVRCIVLQTDGQIIVAGWFTSLGGQARAYIGRLNMDGSLDLTFNPGPVVPLWTTAAYSLAVQADGKILVGGLTRLNNTEPATQSLAVDGVGIAWSRGGSSPEVWRTTFECSTNGMDWFALGEGTRIPGGWYLAGASLTTKATIRARGYTTGGNGNRSAWFVESMAPVGQPRPAILVNDGALGFHPNAFGFNVSALVGQTVVVEGSTDLLNWIPLATNSFGATPQSFNDPAAPGFAKRFYRARTP